MHSLPHHMFPLFLSHTSSPLSTVRNPLVPHPTTLESLQKLGATHCNNDSNQFGLKNTSQFVATPSRIKLTVNISPQKKYSFQPNLDVLDQNDFLTHLGWLGPKQLLTLIETFRPRLSTSDQKLLLPQIGTFSPRLDTYDKNHLLSHIGTFHPSWKTFYL